MISGSNGVGNRRWTSKSIKLETEQGDVVMIAPCGERRLFSLTEARSLALRLQDMASVAEKESMRVRAERLSGKTTQPQAKLC